METFLKYKSTIQTLILSLFLVIVSLIYFKNAEQTARYLFIGSSAVLILVLLFLNFKWYYLLLVGLIPISIDAGFLGGAKLNFPAEGMLALMIPILLLFNSGYHNAISRALKHPLTLLLVLDLFVELLSTILSTHVDVSLKRILIRFLFIIGFFFVVNMIQSKKDIAKPWFLYAFGLVPVMILTLKFHASYSFDPRVSFIVCQPYYDEHTVYGACLAFIIPFLTIVVLKRKMFKLNGTKYFLFILLFGLVLLSEVLALSRAANLSLFVALGFNVLLHYRVKFRSIMIGIVLLIGAGFAFRNTFYEYISKNDAVSNDGQIVNHFSSVTNVQSDASNLERINRWICAYRMFKERPLLGFGPGTYQFEYNQFQTVANKTYISTNSGNKGNAHSEYLSYLSETGIVGFIVFILTVFASIYYGMKNHYHLKDDYLRLINLGILLGLITFYFHGIFNSFMDQSKMAFLYFTALGSIVWLNQYSKNQLDDLAKGDI